MNCIDDWSVNILVVVYIVIHTMGVMGWVLVCGHAKHYRYREMTHLSPLFGIVYNVTQL